MHYAINIVFETNWVTTSRVDSTVDCVIKSKLKVIQILKLTYYERSGVRN